MHRVDQIGVEEFTDSADSAAESNVLALRCLTCLREGRRGSASTKWNVVSDSVNDGRTWWVKTKPGCGTVARRPTSPATRDSPKGRGRVRICCGP